LGLGKSDLITKMTVLIIFSTKIYLEQFWEFPMVTWSARWP